MTKITIESNEHGRGTVTMDGRDISAYVRKVEVTLEVGKVNNVVLTLNPTTFAAAVSECDAYVETTPGSELSLPVSCSDCGFVYDPSKGDCPRCDK